MSSELERRLERALQSIPEIAGEARERARRGALGALMPAPPPRRRMAVRMLVAVAGAACLITAGAALAASGRVEINVGQRSPTTLSPAPPATSLSPLPAGSASLVVEVGGRVWSAGAHAVRPVAGQLSTIAVSPGALYELQAKAHVLRAVTYRSGRVAFTHRVPGRVVAASWSPLPIRIAFIERRQDEYVMHDMWGTGSHDRRWAGRAAPVAPSWRWDSLAVAFVRANGRVAILSPTSGAVETLPRMCAIGHALAVAYSPTNSLLAIANRHQLAIIDTTGSRPAQCLGHAPGRPSLTWVGGHRLALGAGTHLRELTIAWAGVRSQTRTLPGTVAALAPAPHGHRIAIALEQPKGTAVVLATPGSGTRTAPLFTLPGVHGSAQLQWR
jgi:hypothetical protein